MFRDDSSLATTSDVRSDLRVALLSSRLLLVIASPASASSPSVASEIKQWLEAEYERQLMIAWLDGTVAFNQQFGLEANGTSALAPFVCQRYAGGAPLVLDFRGFRDDTAATSGAAAKSRELDFLALLAQIGARVRDCAPGLVVRAATAISIDRGSCMVRDALGREMTFTKTDPANFWNDGENVAREWHVSATASSGSVHGAPEVSSPDARFVIAASTAAEVEVLDVERRRRIDFYKVRDFPGFETPITGEAVCAGGDCAAFVTANRLAHCLWWGDGIRH